MPDESNLNVVSDSLDQALLKMQSLEERINRGDEISDAELEDIAKQVAHGVEDALDALKDLVGREHEQEIEKEMISRMSDDEYKEWTETYPLRQVMRMEREQEKLAKLNG